MSQEITYRLSPEVPNDALNELFAASWPAHSPTEFAATLGHSLVYVCAYAQNPASAGDRLVGFVNLAWDGGIHAFLLDTTVHPDLRRRGIGRELVRRAVEAARERGIAWVHVDYEPSLGRFYTSCGFRPTEAGLILLNSGS